MNTTHPSDKPHNIEIMFRFFRGNAVFCIAAVLAVVSSILVPPDAEYLNYFDFRTLTCLFCTLAVICALKGIRFFTILARKIVILTGCTRTAVLALVYITFLGSMLIANDMALLTFLPLGYYVLRSTGKDRIAPFVFIMQNIAANLGGMLTPFGNPQNLYLYSHFNIPTGEFMSVMVFPFLLAITGITVACLCIKNEPIALESKTDDKLPVGRTVLYLILFAYSIAIVFRAIPFWTGLILIPAVLLFADRKALARVDYILLGTFTCFFIFAGNVSRLEPVRAFFSALLEKNVLLVSSLSCQFISNVPSAILLSRFTENWKELLLGVNIGGTGTLIASLASLITFREFTKHYPERTKRYLLQFALWNFGFLIVLLLFCRFVICR